MLETLFLMPRLPRGGSDLRLGIVPLDTFITGGATTIAVRLRRRVMGPKSDPDSKPKAFLLFLRLICAGL